jgi:hypothetical protein
MHEQAARLASLVGNLLDMARLNAGEVTLRREWQPLEEVIGASIKLLGSALVAHPVKVCAATRPAAARIRRRAARTRVLQPAGKRRQIFARRTVAIDIVASDAGADVEVRVCDRGPGFPAAEQAPLFDMFVRGDGPPASRAPASAWQSAAPSSKPMAERLPPATARTVAPTSASHCRAARRRSSRRKRMSTPKPRVLLIEDEKTDSPLCPRRRRGRRLRRWSRRKPWPGPDRGRCSANPTC